MSLERGLSYARPGTKALKATVPEGVVAFLDLDATDRLNWKMDVIKGKKVVIVTPISTRKNKRK